MQYKFKYSGSIEARKSTNSHHNQVPKNEILPYINLLDKCTQILREDRIWIRNQLKAGDAQMINIFKSTKKPLNLQHLQIKLRKHVTGIKSKAKMEQLMRFKQNMNLGEWNKSRDAPQQKLNNSAQNRQPLAHNQNGGKTYHNSNSMGHAQSNSRNYRARMNNSLEKPQKPVIYPYRNSSNNHSNSRKALHDYPVPMEEITQRQSQNMTSARNRIMGEQNNQGLVFGVGNTYNQWRRPQNHVSPLQGLRKQTPTAKDTYAITINNKMNDYQRDVPLPARNHRQRNSPQKDIYEHYQNRQSLSKQQKIEGSFQKAERSFYDQNQSSYSMLHDSNISGKKSGYKNNFILEQESVIKDSNINSNKRIGFQPYQQKQENSYHKLAEPNYDSIQQSHYDENASESNLMKSMDYNSRNNDSLPQTHTRSHNIQNSYNEQLFTSPELLQECRNFIKNKSSAKSTIQKKQNNFIFPSYKHEQENKYAPLSFDQPQYSHDPTSLQSYDEKREESPKINTGLYSNEKPQLEDTMTRQFNNINCGIDQPETRTESLHFQKQAQPMNFQKNVERYTPQDNIQKQDFNRTYQFFHTFAQNQSSQKKQFQPHRIKYAEQFIDELLALTECNKDSQSQGYVDWNILENLVQRKYSQYLSTFVEYLRPEPQEPFVLISNAGRVMEDLLQSQHEQDNEVRNIYKLLDIEHKGYITAQDLNDFISQLEDAEAEDVQIISQYLWRLFQNIDQDSDQSQEKRIDYWGLYARKNGIYFRQLNEILKQFQFQIE